jgi:hypothetical protein
MSSHQHLLSRRHLLAGGVVAGSALCLARALAQEATPGDPAKGSARAETKPASSAQALIVVWLNGGPSHVDTFDPKQGRDAGPFRSIATRAPDVRFSEHLPALADQADKLVVVRSMTSREGNHDRARALGHTGYAPNPTVAHPSLGAWISSTTPGRDMPSFVSIAGPSAGAGFLGVEHAPFVVPRAGEPPENLRPRVAESRLARRREALAFLERQFGEGLDQPGPAARRGVYARAERLMHSPEIGAFGIDDEPEALRAAYGDSEIGRGCLVARRLVEAGVKVVEVTLDGWDTHYDNFERTKKLCTALDPALATLLRDLAERDRLRSTLVMCLGEFGRTPAINAREGRDHYPRAWSALLAGGGLKMGMAYGATDARGAEVVDKPVPIANLFATVAAELGLDPAAKHDTPGGRPIALTDGGVPIAALRRS